jgi:hypothetical protein
MSGFDCICIEVISEWNAAERIFATKLEEITG